MDRPALLALLAPLTRTIAGLDLAAPDAADRLAAAHPPHALGEVAVALRAARDAGWLTPRRATDTLSFGRLAKPGPETLGFAIDVVDIEGVGAAHAHPRGEVSLALAESGDPRFDGHAAGWVVKAPGSHHAPTVAGGRMLIAYWLPDGAIAWD